MHAILQFFQQGRLELIRRSSELRKGDGGGVVSDHLNCRGRQQFLNVLKHETRLINGLIMFVQRDKEDA